MYLPSRKMVVILYPVIDGQRFFANVTLGRGVELLNLSHCQSLHGLYIRVNFFEVVGKFLQFLHEPFCQLRPPKAAILVESHRNYTSSSTLH